MTALKSLLFLILVPGLVVGYIPFAFLLTGPYIEPGFLINIALPLWVIGGAIVVWCFWDFLAIGRGTPAPFDPPKELVVAGLYRYVRNPMYVGVLAMLLAHFLWFGFWLLLAYAVFFFIAFHLFVVNYEEPTLTRKFGKAYKDYLNRVPRWIPKLSLRLRKSPRLPKS
ncbi:MAG: isoprenylcysteine carboxylmethyltransferase family protein [Anaerolineae bacterium]|nr:isoprenylcysteine carboxylmethyltransferase family protein [Anaerolineae bacterium]